MARTAKRRRRLWDAYSFPGFRPQPTVRGIFGDPKARVITLNRRSKKQLVAVAMTSRWAGTTERSAACAIFRVATLGYFWNWRYGGGKRPPLGERSADGAALLSPQPPHPNTHACV